MENSEDAAAYLIAHGVRLRRRECEEYNYSTCPFVGKDVNGKDCCTLLTAMLCKKTDTILPCGFFPKETKRRHDIMSATGNNKF